MPRIIAGSRKSIILISPDKPGVRPTNDRTKESLFSILTSRYPLSDAVVLDLFSGTGAIGLECLSRGAKKAVFCDKDVSYTKKNIQKCSFERQSEVLKGDCVAALSKLKAAACEFTHVFLDPPYDSMLFERIIENDNLYDIMGKNSVLIAEISDKKKIERKTGKLTLVDKRKYGTCVFAFYIKDDL